MTYADLINLAEHHEQQAHPGALSEQPGDAEAKRRLVAWHRENAAKLRAFAAAIVVAFPDIKTLNDRHPLLTVSPKKS
jgi:hypothetical protein